MILGQRSFFFFFGVGVGGGGGGASEKVVLKKACLSSRRSLIGWSVIGLSSGWSSLWSFIRVVFSVAFHQGGLLVVFHQGDLSVVFHQDGLSVVFHTDGHFSSLSSGSSSWSFQ